MPDSGIERDARAEAVRSRAEQRQRGRLRDDLGREPVGIGANLTVIGFSSPPVPVTRVAVTTSEVAPSRTRPPPSPPTPRTRTNGSAAGVSGGGVSAGANQRPPGRGTGGRRCPGLPHVIEIPLPELVERDLAVQHLADRLRRGRVGQQEAAEQVRERHASLPGVFADESPRLVQRLPDTGAVLREPFESVRRPDGVGEGRALAAHGLCQVDEALRVAVVILQELERLAVRRMCLHDSEQQRARAYARILGLLCSGGGGRRPPERALRRRRQVGPRHRKWLSH